MIINDPNAPSEEMKMPPVPPKDADRSNALEAPPPYSPPAGSSHVPPTSPQIHTPVSVFRQQAPQTVNHFELFSKQDTISGTFLVDPLMPSPSAMMGKKLRRKRDRVWGKSSRKLDINASFHTRHSPITLDLKVVAQSLDPDVYMSGAKIPARINVSSRHGKVNLDVHEVQVGRSLDLHVETRHARIIVMLPPTFDGPLVFNTRHINSVTFLPAFAARTRTLRATDRETVVLCTPPNTPAAAAPPKTLNQMADDDGDRCLIRTKHGKIIVGISGLDRFEEAPNEGGLFKALGRLFESQGKAFGQYMEGHAKELEKKFAERGEVLGDLIERKALERAQGPVGRRLMR